MLFLSRHQLFSSLVTTCLALLVSRAGATNNTKVASGPAPSGPPVRPKIGEFHACTIKLDYKDFDALEKAAWEGWPADPKALGQVVCQDRQAAHTCWAKDCFVGQNPLASSTVLRDINPLDKDGKKTGLLFNARTKIWYPDSRFKPDLLIETPDHVQGVVRRTAKDPLPECYSC